MLKTEVTILRLKYSLAVDILDVTFSTIIHMILFAYFNEKNQPCKRCGTVESKLTTDGCKNKFDNYLRIPT